MSSAGCGLCNVQFLSPASLTGAISQQLLSAWQLKGQSQWSVALSAGSFEEALRSFCLPGLQGRHLAQARPGST